MYLKVLNLSYLVALLLPLLTDNFRHVSPTRATTRNTSQEQPPTADEQLQQYFDIELSHQQLGHTQETIILNQDGSATRVTEEITRNRQTFNATQPNVQKQQVDNKYAVVVDCGSSGTRATIYLWPANVSTSSSEFPFEVQPLRRQPEGELLTVRIRPGLASVRDQPDAASDYMRPIMRFATDNVPQHLQQETPVYFLGTAGLRLLSDLEQQDILDDIARDLTREFAFQNIHTQVISGAQEGAYRWLAANWAALRLSKQFDQDHRHGLASFLRQPPRGRRYGIIEMGGASAQVTFEVTPPLGDSLIKPHLATLEAKRAFEGSQLKLNTKSSRSATGGGGGAGQLPSDHSLNLFSVTFLNFGSDSARGLAIDLLVRDAIRMPNRLAAAYGSFGPFVYSANSSFVIEDPCLPLGSSDSVVKPVSLLYDQSKTIGFTAMPGDNRETLTVRLIGRGNYIYCRLLLERVVQLGKQEQTVCESQNKGNQNGQQASQSGCDSASLLGSYFVPWRQLQFLGLGDLYYTTNEILQASGRFNGPKIQLSAMQVCAINFESLKKQFPDADQFDPRRTLLECFKSTWILVWLQSALLLPMKHLADFKTIDKLNGNELDWTMGALIEQLAARQ